MLFRVSVVSIESGNVQKRWNRVEADSVNSLFHRIRDWLVKQSFALDVFVQFTDFDNPSDLYIIDLTESFKLIVE